MPDEPLRDLATAYRTAYHAVQVLLFNPDVIDSPDLRAHTAEALRQLQIVGEVITFPSPA